jgi:hypothetical protein
MAIRALRTEKRFTVGPWKGDLRKGDVLKIGDGPGEIPQYAADQLLASDIVEEVDDDTETDEWYDSDGPGGEPFGPHGPKPGDTDTAGLLLARKARLDKGEPDNSGVIVTDGPPLLEYSEDATTFDTDRDGQNEVVPGSNDQQVVDERGDIPGRLGEEGGDEFTGVGTEAYAPSDLTNDELKEELRVARDGGDERVAPFSAMNKDELVAEVRKLRRRNRA